MKSLLSKAHIFIFLWAIYGAFEMYAEHEEQVKDLKQQLPVLQAKIKKTIKQKDQVKDYYEDIDEAKQRIEKVALEVEKLQQQLPSKISDNENMALLSGIAKRLNIKNIFITPQAEENKGFYMVKEYDLKANGTFLQFLIFFEQLGLTERIFNVASMSFDKNIKFKQKGRYQLIDASIEITSYRYNDKHKEDRGIDKIESSFKGEDKDKPKKKKKKSRKKK